VPARDIYHSTVKTALEKDGWTITHDPFPLQIGKKRLSADLGAERLISADKGIQKIVVEVKSFVGQSDVKDLEQALGQYILYRQILNETKIERGSLSCSLPSNLQQRIHDTIRTDATYKSDYQTNCF
jgi:hypothetical protein